MKVVKYIFPIIQLMFCCFIHFLLRLNYNKLLNVKLLKFLARVIHRTLYKHINIEIILVEHVILSKDCH